MDTLDRFESEIDGYLIRKVRAETLRYAAGRTMLCPKCGDIMDYRRTALIEVFGTDGGRQAQAYCTTCVTNDTIARFRQMVTDPTIPVQRIEVDTLDRSIVLDRDLEEAAQ
jgi:hypothetical protein